MSEQTKTTQDRDTMLRLECINALPGILMSSEDKDPAKVLSSVLEVAFTYKAKSDSGQPS